MIALAKINALSISIPRHLLCGGDALIFFDFRGNTSENFVYRLLFCFFFFHLVSDCLQNVSLNKNMTRRRKRL